MHTTSYWTDIGMMVLQVLVIAAMVRNYLMFRKLGDKTVVYASRRLANQFLLTGISAVCVLLWVFVAHLRLIHPNQPTP